MVDYKEEVVISGFGGVYPECCNLDELKDLLFNKINGVTIDSRRWTPDTLGTSAGTGKLKSINKFDNIYFSAHPKITEVMDVMTRQCLERTIDAVIDAGLSPADLYGTNTGVFMGSALSETEMLNADCPKATSYSLLGRCRTMQANRVSFALNLTGPSFSMDGGWICGSNGLANAKKMIENGIITAAFVGNSNLTLRPEMQLQFEGLNKLNRSDRTKSFSSDADGYNRSEACIVMLLQKASDAKRSYGTLLSVKSVQFGDHERYLTNHTKKNFKSLLLDVYKEANIDPATIEFVEAYGSGIKNDDSMELKVMDEVFCTERRTTPLKIGSVKSNVGHCEAAGLFMSIVKAIIALDSGYIPPNINYSKPNENIESLINGKIQVVTEKTPLVSDIIGINSFGILNAFSHVILKRHNKVKKPNKDSTIDDYIPRLILASGRNENNTRETINKIMLNGNDLEFIALTHEVFTRNINYHFYRSYSIYPKPDESRIDDVWNVNLKKRPVWYIFSGMGSQWQGMGTHFMKLPIFANAINKCDTILKPRGVDIKHILTSLDSNLFDNILNSFVGIAAIQIGLVEVLNALDITPDGIIGHSVGELGCAYADGCFTAEEMILSAYARGRASLETELIPGMMAAIGLGYHEIKDRIPHNIDVACRNSGTSCTISGPVDSVNAFVSELKSEGIFAKAVNVAGIAYHSRYIQSAGPTLLKYLKKVIKEPKLRSAKWISSSLPESKWDTNLAKYSSPEYHTNNLLSSVFFEDALKHIPNDAIVIEIAPHGLLQAIIKNALPEFVINIPLTKKIFGDSVRFLLSAIGKMYTSGLNPRIQELYPKITFPVSRGTPSLQNLPFFDHTQQWSKNIVLDTLMNSNSAEKMKKLMFIDDIHTSEYQIHGYNILPLSYILFNVWKMFVEMNLKTILDEPVQFINLRFKNIKIYPTNSTDIYIMIQSGSGLFEYHLDNEVICSGQISFINNKDFNIQLENSIALDITSNGYLGSALNSEIYDILEHSGLNVGHDYKNIIKFEDYEKNIQGYVKWTNDWIYFLDGLLKFPLLENLGICQIEVPVAIREISIIPTIFKSCTEKIISVNYNILTKDIICNGVKISDVKYSPVMWTKLESSTVTLQEIVFIKFNHYNCKIIDDFIHDSMNIILEAEKLNMETIGKLILCNPYHYNDPMFKSCTKAIKGIIGNQHISNSTTMNWEYVQNVTEDDELGRFITVTNVNYLQDTTRKLANKKCSYIIVYSKQKLQDLKDWKIIIQQKFNDGNYLYFLRKEIILEVKVVYIKSISDSNYDLNIALENYSVSKKLIYVVSKSEPIEGICTYVETLFNKYKSQRLRFLFILDENAPDFESDKLFYMNQLSKGLIVNIYKHGGWGFYKRIVFQKLKPDTNVTENLPSKTLSINWNNKITVEYLGLNFKHLVVEDNAENAFGPLEYTGYIENNERIMGIASFEKQSSQNKYDALLSWPIPSIWSLEDAATVPLTYAISYYVFNILCSLQKNHSILVTSGLHPIGQAAISIGLAEKCETYVIVESTQQADHLSNIFPELERSRIIINSNNKFDIQLKMITRSKRIDLVLNFLSDEAFQVALRTVADTGKFFHFSQSDMRNYNYIGTKVFLLGASFFIVTSNMLLNESGHNKEIIQKAFVNGLNNGVIKPFPRSVLTMPLSSSKIFNAMRTNFTLITSKKVVLPINSDFENSSFHESSSCVSYQCTPEQIYVIIGNKSDWLELTEWLVDRGAQNIVISVKTCLMSSITCRRFKKLISRNVSIQIVSDSHLITKDETLKWLNHLTYSHNLGSIFIVNQFDNCKMSNLQYAFEENTKKVKTTSFICISSKTEHICTELRLRGLIAIHISWDGMLSRSKDTAKLLLSLDTLLQNSNSIKSSSFVCSENSNNSLEWSPQMNDIIANYFPDSIEELHLMTNKLTKAVGFFEVPTKSPRYSDTKSVTPVFIIPGFIPKSTDSLYKGMFYPVFEAQLPEDISSIDELSVILVNELIKITDQEYVSLIGESWGGIVALKMAQILEARGIMVTVSLLEGDPEILTNWTRSFLSNDNFTKKLNTIYGSFFNGYSKYSLQNNDEEFKSQNKPLGQRMSEENTQRALKTICSRLQALLESKPLQNKLHTKVLVIRYRRTLNFNKINLNDYCINPPFVYMSLDSDFKRMLASKDIINILTKMVIHPYSIGIEMPLKDKYKNYYTNFDECFKILN